MFKTIASKLYLMILCVRNSGRAQLGNSTAPYDVVWGHSVVLMQGLSGLEGLRHFHSYTLCLLENGRKLGSAGALSHSMKFQGSEPCRLSSRVFWPLVRHLRVLRDQCRSCQPLKGYLRTGIVPFLLYSIGQGAHRPAHIHRKEN